MLQRSRLLAGSTPEGIKAAETLANTRDRASSQLSPSQYPPSGSSNYGTPLQHMINYSNTSSSQYPPSELSQYGTAPQHYRAANSSDMSSPQSHHSGHPTQNRSQGYRRGSGPDTMQQPSARTKTAAHNGYPYNAVVQGTTRHTSASGHTAVTRVGRQKNKTSSRPKAMAKLTRPERQRIEETPRATLPQGTWNYPKVSSQVTPSKPVRARAPRCRPWVIAAAKKHVDRLMRDRDYEFVCYPMPTTKRVFMPIRGNTQAPYP